MDFRGSILSRGFNALKHEFLKDTCDRITLTKKALYTLLCIVIDGIHCSQNLQRLNSEGRLKFFILFVYKDEIINHHIRYLDIIEGCER